MFKSHCVVLYVSGSDLHGKLGWEGEGVSTEATVRAGQWSGHSIFSSSPNHNEEGMFGGLWKNPNTIQYIYSQDIY